MRLEDLELAQSNHNLNSEEICVIYKQQIKMLEEQNKREGLQWKTQLEKRDKAHMNTLLRSEEKLLTRIKRLESNEEVIKKEQKLIADERVLQVEQRMQKTVDELTVKISVYLEKLQKKEHETRKLYAQFSEAKNAGANSASMKTHYEQRISEMRHQYEE